MVSAIGLDGSKTAYTYDAAGRRITTASSTLTTTYAYDSVGNLLAQATSGVSNMAFQYSYNRNNYITDEVRLEAGKTTSSSYTYDPLGEVTSFLQSTGYAERYTYDRVGNMLQKAITGTDGAQTPLKMSYNKSNQLTKMASGKDAIAYSYDANGSMVKKVLSSKQYGKLTDTYAYTAMDQLASYVGYDGCQQQFTYDANGMRLSKSETGNSKRSTLEDLLRGEIEGLPHIVEPTIGENTVPAELAWATTAYLYDITQEYYQVIEEKATQDGHEYATAYDYGLERIAAYGNEAKTSYVYDGRGSVAQTVTAYPAGQATLDMLPNVAVGIQSFSYTAFGEQMGSSKVSGFGYNAEAFDAATGMVNLRARQYEPTMGRFAQKDILRSQGTHPVLLNRYAYAHNDPVQYCDPTGMWEVAVEVNNVKYSAKNAQRKVDQLSKAASAAKAANDVKKANASAKAAYSFMEQAYGVLTDTQCKAYDDAKKELTALEKRGNVSDVERAAVYSKACGLIYRDSYWNQSDSYFSPFWWQDKQKLEEAVGMLIDEAQASGYISLPTLASTMSISEKNLKIYAIQALVNADGTGYFDAQTLSMLENNLFAADFAYDSQTVYNLTPEALQVLDQRKEEYILTEFSDWLQRGGQDVVNGLLVLGGGALYSWANGVYGTTQRESNVNPGSKDAARSASITNDVLEAPRAGSALKLDSYHAFSDIVDNYAGIATKTSVNNGTLYQVEGSLNGVQGRFEWIIDGNTGKYPGQVSHRMFVPNGIFVGGR